DLLLEIRKRLGLVIGNPRWSAVVPLVEVLASSVRDLVHLCALPLSRDDQLLVFQLCQRRVHRPRARPPAAIASLLDCLHRLVPIARLLGQKQQERDAYVASPPPSPAAQEDPVAEHRAGAEMWTV